MTLQHGYALRAGETLEDLDMGGGSRLSLQVTGQESAGSMTVIEGLLHTGGPPLHVHEAEDEVVVVLEGSLMYQVGDVHGQLTAGGLLWFPRKVPHAIANHAETPARFLTIVTPAGIEDFFRAQRDYLAALGPTEAPDAVAMASIPGAGQRTAVGPPMAPPLGNAG